MTSPPIVEARAASLGYHTPRGRILAVDEASLAIHAGECVAILGRSGSGKSTLLALLAGLCDPTSGEVLFAGRPWRTRTQRERAAAWARDISLLFQDAGLLPGLRAIDNVLLPAVLAGRSQAEATARAEELLGLVGLYDRWDAYPAELSGGQQRRVALARALAAEPAMMCVDEPTSDLDGLAAREIVTILERVRHSRTMTLVIVTHDPTLASIADRRVWIEQGRCTELAPEAESLISSPTLLSDAVGDGRDAVFEAPPADLMPLRPASGVRWLFHSWLPFLAGVVLSAAGLAFIDGLVARRQDAVVQTAQANRRLAEEMAMQDLRADVDDVVMQAEAQATVTVFLQNYRPERPLHVLGPAFEIGIQRDGRWDNVPIDGETPSNGIRTVGREKTLIPLRFTVPEGRYDELLRGYLHVRIGAAMVVSDREDGSGDLFERQDAYYVYLRDPRQTEDQVRRANAWGEKATVPLWIAMPAH